MSSSFNKFLLCFSLIVLTHHAFLFSDTAQLSPKLQSVEALVNLQQQEEAQEGTIETKRAALQAKYDAFQQQFENAARKADVATMQQIDQQIDVINQQIARFDAQQKKLQQDFTKKYRQEAGGFAALEEQVVRGSEDVEEEEEEEEEDVETEEVVVEPTVPQAPRRKNLGRPAINSDFQEFYKRLKAVRRQRDPIAAHEEIQNIALTAPLPFSKKLIRTIKKRTFAFGEKIERITKKRWAQPPVDAHIKTIKVLSKIKLTINDIKQLQESAYEIYERWINKYRSAKRKATKIERQLEKLDPRSKKAIRLARKKEKYQNTINVFEHDLLPDMPNYVKAMGKL